MTPEERIAALSFLGYGPRQTRFLVLVALHGGFCVRRQYALFAGTACGKNAQHFLDDLVERRLARRVSVERSRGYLYHLTSRPVYRAVGQEDNRNRRATAPSLIARKLMLLDFALAQVGDEWCTTEQEKVALCADRFGIPLEQLPHCVYSPKTSTEQATARYFMDKLPFFLVGRPQVLHVVFLATGSSLEGFSRFLRDHSGVLTRVPRWAVVLVGPKGSIDEAAYRGRFRTFLEAPPARRSASEADLRWYFETRRAIELDKNPALSPKLILRYQTARHRFSDSRFESLYRHWSAHGDAALEAGTSGSPAVLPTRGKLLIHELPFIYDQFGTLPGVA